MFLRVNKLQIELPPSASQDPNAAAALQELGGGRIRGEALDAALCGVKTHLQRSERGVFALAYHQFAVDRSS